LNAINTEGLVYSPARRRSGIGILVMLAGPSGSGKTKSALLLARGLAGPTGKIAVADTEHERALYYAPLEGKPADNVNTFDFAHLPINEPFRPSKFEAAAVAAQQQEAIVWICDSFTHEHVGPGGMLDFFEEELTRLGGDNYTKREQMKALAWVKPKGEHKHMLQRLWQMNCHIILCCQAEKKLALVPITEGPKKGKNDWVDQGFQPVCGSDIPYAMTASFMFDVKRPGVPIVIKPMLDDMAPLIDLASPITVSTGERLAAWARGEVSVFAPSKKAAKSYAPPADSSASNNVSRGTLYEHEQQAVRKTDRAAPPDEETIKAGAQKLADLFLATDDRKAHLAIVDDPDTRKQMEWLRRNRRELFDRIVNPAIKASWQRTDPARQQQGNLIPAGAGQ
jgi:energy-coupling factor transporter ATP-binding protein EcfA2